MKTIIFLLLILICLSPQESSSQWILQNSGTKEKLTDIVMLDSLTAIAVGRNSSILRTTNAGVSWLNVAALLSYHGPWNAISFTDTANGVVVGDEGIVMTSTNGGKNWMWHQIPGGRKCFSVLHNGPGSCLVGADSGWVYQSNDTGKTWLSEKISSWPIRSFFPYRGPVIFGVPLYALTPHSFCMRFVIPPPAWSEKIMPQFQPLGSEGFNAEFSNGGGSGFIVGVQGDKRSEPTILRKKLSDTSWSKVPTGILKDGVLLGVSSPSEKFVYVCGSEGMIFISTNGGDTWNDISAPTTQSLNAIYFYNEKRGFAVGDSGMIFFTTNGGGITGLDEVDESVPLNYELYQNYPNPFNPTTTINYQLPHSGNIELKVYDVLGKEVAALVSDYKEEGFYTVRFNASNLSGGVYIYKLVSDKFTDAKKMLVLK